MPGMAARNGRIALKWTSKKVIILASVLALLIFAGIIFGLYMLGGDHQAALEKLRDIAIIFSQLLLLVIVILLAGVVAGLIFLIFQIKDRVIPLLEEAKNTVNEATGTAKRVKDTTNYVTEEVVRPLITAQGQFARIRQMSSTVKGKYKKAPTAPTFRDEKKVKETQNG